MAEQCTAKSKTTGERCKQPAVEGRKVCRFHGGLSLQGPESATWKHGKYSKVVMPETLRKHVERLAGDPDALSLRRSVDRIRAMQDELLEAVGEDGAIDSKTRRTLVELIEQERRQVESWNRILTSTTIPQAAVVALLVDLQRKLIETLDDESDRRKLAVLLAWLEGRMEGR
jgi:hypothetical protein